MGTARCLAFRAVGADKVIDDAHQHMQERLIEKGYSPTIAKVMAMITINRRAGTHQSEPGR